MIAQLELQAFQAAPDDPNVRELEKILHEAKDWLTARRLVELTGWPDRLVRELASASEWILSGPGSPGYKHLQFCPLEEVKHYTNAGLSQGKQMIKRSLRLRRRAHQLVG